MPRRCSAGSPGPASRRDARGLRHRPAKSGAHATAGRRRRGRIWTSPDRPPRRSRGQRGRSRCRLCDRALPAVHSMEAIVGADDCRRLNAAASRRRGAPRNTHESATTTQRPSCRCHPCTPASATWSTAPPSTSRGPGAYFCSPARSVQAITHRSKLLIRPLRASAAPMMWLHTRDRVGSRAVAPVVTANGSRSWRRDRSCTRGSSHARASSRRPIPRRVSLSSADESEGHDPYELFLRWAVATTGSRRARGSSGPWSARCR